MQKQIVGAEKVDGMYASASEDVAHIQRYLSANCFGDYVARSGLDLRTRELLTFSMLVALGGADAQVKGHVAGNLNVGNDRATLLAVLTQLLPFIGYPRTLNGLNAVNEIAPRPKDDDHGTTHLADHRHQQWLRSPPHRTAARPR